MLEKNVRILLISPVSPPAGGIATWTEQYIDWANNNDLNIDIVNTAVIGNKVKKINSKTKLFDEIKRTKNILKSLNRKINEFKPDIIHLNTPCGKLGIIRDYICAKIIKKNKIKLVVHYRCNIEDQVDERSIQKYFLQKLSNISDINLVLNNYSKQYLMKETQRNSTQVANFINQEFILNEPKTITKDIRIISFVGHVQRTKGILEIIDVAKCSPEITYKIVGPISKDISKIDKPSNMIFLGPLPNEKVKTILIESDVFLFPSYTEGFSNALLEAMAIGIPIITTPVGANIDMIESTGGLIVEVGNSKGIIEAIKCMKSSSDRLKMSEWNLNKVKKKYTIEKVMKKLISIYLDEL